MNRIIVSMRCTANFRRAERLRFFCPNHVNERNDNTRKLLIEAANSFESVQTESFNYIHRVTTLTSTTVRKCVGATSF